MIWQKKGLIFKAEGQCDWMKTHTSMPSALRLSGNHYRIYFATRCCEQKTRIAFVEIDLSSPQEILHFSSQPALDLGCPGNFDDSGLYPGNITVDTDGNLMMYYSGRNNGAGPLYYMSIGLAKGHVEEKSFKRKFKYPIIARSAENPWMVSTPFVMKDQEKLHMFCISGKGWSDDLSKSYYDLKHATSLDGLEWDFNKEAVIPLRLNETNIAAPSVVRWKDKYLMFYSYVSPPSHYKIGWAVSKDLLSWERQDDPYGLDLGPEQWDSESMAYPHVFIHDEDLYILYSGNGNGLAGMGIAKYVGA